MVDSEVSSERKCTVEKRGHVSWRYLFASLDVDGEQSPTVALGAAGDAAHLRGRGQVCGLQEERKMDEKGRGTFPWWRRDSLIRLESAFPLREEREEQNVSESRSDGLQNSCEIGHL